MHSAGARPKDIKSISRIWLVSLGNTHSYCTSQHCRNVSKCVERPFLFLFLFPGNSSHKWQQEWIWIASNVGSLKSIIQIHWRVAPQLHQYTCNLHDHKNDTLGQNNYTDVYAFLYTRFWRLSCTDSPVIQLRITTIIFYDTLMGLLWRAVGLCNHVHSLNRRLFFSPQYLE